MRKRQRNLIIAVAVLLALIGAFVGFGIVFGWFSQETTDETDTTATTTTAPLKSEEEMTYGEALYDRTKNAQGGAVSQPIREIAIQNHRDSYKVITRSDNTMAVEAYQDLLTDTMSIDTLCGYLSTLRVLKTLEPTEDTAQFGFADPSATVTVTFYDDTTETLEIGNASQGTVGYYARRQGDDHVYIVHSDIAESLLAEGKSFIGKSLIGVPPRNADDTTGQAQLLQLWLTGRCRPTPVEIAVDTDGEHASMTYVSTYVMKAPYLRAVDSDAFHVTASTMTSLTAVGVECPHPTTDQLAEYGLSDPYSVAAFTLSIVSTASGENGGSVSTHYNDREHMILLGNKDENGNYYALVDGYDTVYLLSPASVPWAEATHLTLMSKLLFMKAITEVDEIAILHDGTETAFKLEHRPEAETRDEQMIVTANGKTYSTRDFRTLYQLMISVKRVAEKEAGATVSGEPVLRFELTFNDGTAPMTVSMYPMTASRYLCVTDDGEQTAVSIRDTETFLTQYENYLKGEPVYSQY